MTTSNISFNEYQKQKNNPWAKASPTSADHFQMITEQNMRDGQTRADAEANAVQEMQYYKANNINPMGPINGREAGFNESQGRQLQQEGEAWQQQQNNAADRLFGQQVGQAINYQGPTAEQMSAQAIADKQKQNNVMNEFNQWLMQRGQPPVGSPPSTMNKGWNDATDALQNLRNLELPQFKR